MAAEPELPSSSSTPTRPPATSGARLPSTDAPPPASGSSAELPSDAPPQGRPASAPPVADVPVETRRDRIVKATAAGGLHALPSGFDEATGDWECVRSDNAFEVLYLDHEQWAQLTQAVVERHYGLFHAFWKDKKLKMHGGPAGRQIARRFGGEERVDAYPALVERAYARVASREAREQEFQRIETARRGAGIRTIVPMVDACLADSVLHPSETEALLEFGAGAGLRAEETIAYLRQRLADGGFEPVGTPAATAGIASVASVAWMTAAKRAEAPPPAVAPFKFEHGKAGSVVELVALCDRYPEEAASYLYLEYLERWLSGTLGEARLAAEVRSTRRTYPDDRHKGLELVVRLLLAHAGAPAVVGVRALPAALALGELPMGAMSMSRIELQSEGRRRVWGSVRCEPPLPGLVLSTEFEGPGATAQVTLDTCDVAPGEYAAQLVFETVGGAAPSRVPVQFQVVPLELAAEPAAVALGTIAFGPMRIAKMRVRTAPPGGRLTGTIALLDPHPGVQLDGTVYGDAPEFTVAVDTRQFRAGSAYASTMRLTTNAGTLDVPVSFRVRLRASVVALWTLVGAAAGGWSMSYARQQLTASGGYDGWFLPGTPGMQVSQDNVEASFVFLLGFAAVAWGIHRVSRRSRGATAKEMAS